MQRSNMLLNLSVNDITRRGPKEIAHSNMLLNLSISDFNLRVNDITRRGSNMLLNHSILQRYNAGDYLLVKSDVYNFSAVLLEILIGRNPIDCIMSKGEHSLVKWAQKIIALCGWEPCMLPYSVNTKSETSKYSEETNNEETTQCIIHTADSAENEKVRSSNPSVSENQYDLPSVTLDCKLCGARVGLWAFKAIQRSLELFTVIAESNGHFQSVDENSNKEGQNTSMGPGSKLTIAGGPLLTKQNFRPVVSFPIISRNFRAKWYYNSDFSGTSLKRKRADNEILVSKNNDVNNIAQNGSVIGNIGAEEVNEGANIEATDLDHTNLASEHNNQGSSDIDSNSADRSKETVKDSIKCSNNIDDSTTNGVVITTLSLVNTNEIPNSRLVLKVLTQDKMIPLDIQY